MVIISFTVSPVLFPDAKLLHSAKAKFPNYKIPVVMNSDRVIEMEVDSSKQSVPSNLNGQIECKRNELQKQNKFLLNSASDLIKQIFDLNERRHCLEDNTRTSGTIR